MLNIVFEIVNPIEFSLVAVALVLSLSILYVIYFAK